MASEPIRRPKLADGAPGPYARMRWIEGRILSLGMKFPNQGVQHHPSHAPVDLNLAAV
jgi:hypothetical protein